MLEKKCKDCEIIKDVKEFYIKRSSKDGYHYKCKVCFSKKYYEEKKDKIKEHRKVYYEENKDRKRKYAQVMSKKCKDCEIIKDIKEFYTNRSSKDGYRNRCKGCNKKKYYEEKIDKIKEYREVYYENNKNKIRESERKYYENNKDRILIVKKEYIRNRISNDPLYKLSHNMRTLIRNSLRNGGYNKDSKSNDILGCSYGELLDHLNNNEYGFIFGDDNLDIDHIIPLSRATSEEEIIELNHYSNLQLLPSEYNRYVKSDKDFDIECLEEWLSNKKISDLGI